MPPKPNLSRKRIPPPPFVPSPPFDDTLDALRDNLNRADAMFTAADELIVKMWSDDDEEQRLRRRNHISYLMESGHLAVQLSIYAANELEARRRRGV